MCVYIMRWLREIPTGIIFTKKSVVSIYFELVKSSTPTSFNDTHTQKHTESALGTQGSLPLGNSRQKKISH